MCLCIDSLRVSKVCVCCNMQTNDCKNTKKQLPKASRKVVTRKHAMQRHIKATQSKTHSIKNDYQYDKRNNYWSASQKHNKIRQITTLSLHAVRHKQLHKNYKPNINTDTHTHTMYKTHAHTVNYPKFMHKHIVAYMYTCIMPIHVHTQINSHYIQILIIMYANFYAHVSTHTHT